VAAALVVGELHHIIIIAVLVVAPDVEDIDEPGMILRDFFVALNALELAFESALEFKVLATYDLHRPVHAGDGTGKIDLSVRTSADAAEELEVGNLGVVGCPGDTGL
jgi:hypothetical protein